MPIPDFFIEINIAVKFDQVSKIQIISGSYKDVDVCRESVLLLAPLPFSFIQDDLADPNGFRRDFGVFIALNIFHGFLK